MTTTETIYPYDVTQTTGGHYQVFDKLGNLKQSSGYAVSARPIDYKNGTTYTPSTITAYFKLKIPTNAEIRKVTVQYKHYVDKLAISKGYPSSTPTIVIGSKVNSKTFNQKGNAPTKTSTMRTATFTNVEVDVNSFFNNGNFRVQLKYAKNSTNNYGKVHLAYIRVIVDYVQPDFNVTVSKVSGGYNQEEYSIKATISNKNLTKGNPTVNFVLPLGLTYLRPSGNGSVSVNGRVLTWTPSINRAGSVSVEIVLMPNVTYSSQSKTWSEDISYSMPSYGRTGTHTVNIIEKPAAPDIETDDSDNIITEDGNRFDYYNLTNDVEMDIELTLTDEEKTLVDNNMMMYCVPNNGFDPITGTWNEIKAMHDDNATMCKSEGIWTHCIDEIDPTLCFQEYHIVNLKFHTLGRFSIIVWASSTGDLSDGQLVKQINLESIPSTDYLNISDYTIIDLTEEELLRLGDGYGYTVQSDMKLTSNETYVRNWHKNFRIGVFNNPIEANQHKYMVYQSEETSQIRDIVIPSRYQLENIGIRMHSEGPMRLIIDETEYDVFPEPVDLTFEEYSQSVTFVQNISASEFFYVEIWDSEYTEKLEQIDYFIIFEADETLPPYQQIDDSTDYTALTDTEIFNNAEYWGDTLTKIGEYENLTCPFVYESDYPLHIIITGDFMEGNPRTNELTFNEPCIIEDYQERLTNGIFPVSIEDLVLSDGSISELILDPFTKSNTVTFYDLPLDDGYGTNAEMAIRGIELIGDIAASDNITLYANLKSPTGDSRQRTLVLDENDTEFVIGGVGDLWGFTTLDFQNLENWEIELTCSNVLYDSQANFNFGNIQLVIYIEKVETQNITCYIEGEDIGYYGAFITDVTIPEGLETETNYLSVDGTDINDAYRQNIKEKTIELEIDIGDGCSLENSTFALREFTKLLVNERDEYNRPIPKRIEFSHYPEVFWEYVMEEAFDSELDINDYHVKAKLTIPAGTSFDKESSITGNSGYINGLASINPIITFKPTNAVVSITETVTGQKFNMAYPNDWDDKIVEINTEERKAYLKTEEDDTDKEDISKYVDFNSNWFSLIREFNFEGTNCIIRTVEYQERW